METILLVEDTPALANEISDLFEMEGFRVVIASNGKEGLDKIRKANPDVIITDLLMPEMDGFEMIARIKMQPDISQTPIIVITAKSGDETDEKASKLGIQKLIRKPCRGELLIDSVREVLSSIKA